MQQQSEIYSERVNVRITPSTLQALEEIAKSTPLVNGITAHVRQAIDEYIAKVMARETIDA